MARYRKHESLHVMREARLVGLYHHADVDAALKILKSCSNGGLLVVEFVNCEDGALEVFADLEERC